MPPVTYKKYYIVPNIFHLSQKFIIKLHTTDLCYTNQFIMICTYI